MLPLLPPILPSLYPSIRKSMLGYEDSALPEFSLPPANHENFSPKTVWTKLEDKFFENALAMFKDDTLDRLGKVAMQVPDKTPQEVENHYQLLVEDIKSIESGRIPLPHYINENEEKDSDDQEEVTDSTNVKRKEEPSGVKVLLRKDGRPSQKGKGIPWDENEHRLFLLGLDKYGRGDWKSISRLVISKTPTQVASHAQKYYKHLNDAITKVKRRPSIYDVKLDSQEPPAPSANVNMGIHGPSLLSAGMNCSPMAGVGPLIQTSNNTGFMGIQGSLPGAIPEQYPSLYANFVSLPSHNLRNGMGGNDQFGGFVNCPPQNLSNGMGGNDQFGSFVNCPPQNLSDGMGGNDRFGRFVNSPSHNLIRDGMGGIVQFGSFVNNPSYNLRDGMGGNEFGRFGNCPSQNLTDGMGGPEFGSFQSNLGDIPIIWPITF